MLLCLKLTLHRTGTNNEFHLGSVYKIRKLEVKLNCVFKER